MGTLYVIATPIGNLNDISPRAIEILKNSDLILCEDTRHSIKLLNYFDIKNKLQSYHKFNETKKSNEIINKLLTEDVNISLISDAGTPCISDPGYIIVKEAREHNINVIGIPGSSAAITALSISGLNTESFSFYGFFPRENKKQKELLDKINKSDINTFIFYESPNRLLKTLNIIKDNISIKKIVVCHELTKIHEKSYFGSIEKVINDLENDENNNLGEYVFIIEKKEKLQDEEYNISIEALLVDEMISKNISLKEAISELNKKNPKLSKNSIYNASLKLKQLI